MLRKLPPFNHSLRLCRSRAGFTLIELLVVITIIGVLVGVLLPVVSSVTVNAQKTAAKNTELQIVTAVKNFKTEYNVYPMPSDAQNALQENSGRICFGSSAPKAAELFDILQASEAQASSQGLPTVSTPINSRGIAYLQLPMAKSQVSGANGLGIKGGLGPDGTLYDPWGRTFFVGIDGGYTGYVNNPYSSGAGSSPELHTGVIAYSWGPDTVSSGKFFGGGGAKTDAPNIDDVLSWQ